MPNLNPAFTSVRSYSDLVDTLTANPSETTRFTQNDVVRAWNILVHAKATYSNYITLQYAEINISQSSVRTIVSKLNMLFRHLGILGYNQGIRIEYSDFNHANVNIAAIHQAGVLGTLHWNLTERQATGGRRQDRTTARHQERHRRTRTGRTIPPVFEPATAIPAVPSVATMGATLAGLLDGFNPFEGIGDSILATLRAEANA